MKKNVQHLPFLLNILIIFTAAIDLLDQGRSLGYAYLACALIYLVMVILVIKQRIRNEYWMDGAGALLMIIIAFDYYMQGRRGLPFAYIAAAIVFLIAARYRKNRTQKQSSID